MSIQGSVNQLFTIAGSFAGMYGLLHPEAAKRKEIMKDIQAGKDTVSKYEGKKDLSLGERDILDKTVQRIEKNIEENPQLMKDPEVEKIYGNIKKSYPERLAQQELTQEVIRKKADMVKSHIKSASKTNYEDIDWNADDVYVSPLTDKPQTALQTEGMQKVQQNANYEQRRKDKGDI